MSIALVSWPTSMRVAPDFTVLGPMDTPLVPPINQDVTLTQFLSSLQTSNLPDPSNSTGSKNSFDISTLQELLTSKIGGDEGPFYWVNLKTVVAKYIQWIQELPKVTPYYAVKCNPDPGILRVLATLGCNFDCASLAEIQLVQSLAVSADRIIFANPVKMVSHLIGARQVEVKRMTFDNEDELNKIAQHYPEAELVLRIITDDSTAMCSLSSKYGARLEDCPELIKRCLGLSLKLIGVSFHVGSGGARPDMFRTAIMNAKRVFGMARELGIDMKVLDIGGGFPGDDSGLHPFKVLANEIRSVLAAEFPDIIVIAEPGRYFVTEAYTLVCSVIGRRVMTINGTKKILYYLNDGIYQSFNCIFFDHTSPRPEVFSSREDERYMSTVFGPTCDGLDCIAKDIVLPELQIGDWVYFRNMGAYTVAAASQFNGFALPQRMYYFK